MSEVRSQVPLRLDAASDGGAAAGPRPRLLLVGRAGPEAHDAPDARWSRLFDEVSRACDVVPVPGVAEALSQLRAGGFDGVLTDAGGFQPMEQALLGQQAGQVLDTIGEGVAIVDQGGRCLWMNRRMSGWPPAVHEQVKRTCIDALRHFRQTADAARRYETAPPADAASPPHVPLSKRYHVNVEDEKHLELIASPILTPPGPADAAGPQPDITKVVAVVFDATGTRRLQQKIDAIDKAGAELVKIESESVAVMGMAERLTLLEEKVIRVTRDLMHFDHFNIRLIDPASARLELVVANGLPPEALDLELYTEGEHNGISGYVARSGRSYICPDVTRDPRYVTGLDGARSSLTVPLTLDDKIIGVFNIESRRTAAFTEDDRQFAEIFGRYVAIALSILKLIVTERAATNKKVAGDVSSEIAGPLNDIALDASSLLDEFIGQDELRDRLQSILDNVEVIRGCLRQVIRGPQTILGARELAEEPPPDPQLAAVRVLIVDDESHIRETIADVLRKYRMDVSVVTSGQAAIDRLRPDAAAFDLVLSDIKMPDKTGYDVFAAARRLDPAPPVILMTGFGYDPNHCIVRASQEGLAAVLFKPFRVEQLMAEVRSAVTATASNGD